MSNRPKRRMGAFPEAGPGEGYAGVPAIVVDRTEPGALEHARKASHDRLIRAWGPLRRSGIWWTERPGASGRRMFVELHDGEPPDAEALEIWDNNPRALLVVAWAIVREGEPLVRLPGVWTGRDA